MDDEHAAHLDMKVGGSVEYRTAGMDIAANLTQGGQTGGYRELWRFLRELFNEAAGVDERSDNAAHFRD
jgi:hypothetical protein